MWSRRSVEASRVARPPSRSFFVPQSRLGRIRPARPSRPIGAASRKQKRETSSTSLTTHAPSPMMWRSSARRRLGQTEDVLRTNVWRSANPHRVGRGATVRTGGGLPATVADPVDPRVGPPENLLDGLLDMIRPLCNYSR